ncbi:MAG: right-handed parallel beta-helix repeat-containing protein, partial [Candidatus Nanopelagicales bacterium]
VDGVRLSRSSELTGTSPAAAMAVPLPADARVLRLVVTGGADIHYDHADWADAAVRAPMPLVFRNVNDDFPPDAAIYGPVATAQPGGSVSITVGTDIQSVVNANPAGTVYWIQAGTHRHQSITPKNGDQFWGEYGAILSGAKVLTGAVADGSDWRYDGQTQEGGLAGFACLPGFPRCRYVEDLWIDGVWQKHVDSRGAMTANTWYFDYAADRIYIRNNPAGKLVETSVTARAFQGSASNVLIRNLVIEQYATLAQDGAVRAENGSGWTVRNCDIRKNHAYGIRTGSGLSVYNTKLNDNGQIGSGGPGSVILFDTCEFARNNVAGFDYGWEGGGSKWAETDHLTVRYCYVHDNVGPGLWTDINNYLTLYEYNVVEDNIDKGIFHEISFDCIIRYNQVRRNGFGFIDWLWGAGIIVAASGGIDSDIVVHDNIVEDNADGIALIQQNRGSGEPHGSGYGVLPWHNKNILVRDNIIRLGGTNRQTGAVDDAGDLSYGRNIRFVNNTYFLAGADAFCFEWLGAKNQAGWQAAGQDLTGTFNY